MAWYNTVMQSIDVRTVLWDINPEKIAMLPSVFVVQRALAYGSVFLIAQVLKDVGLTQTKTVFEAMKPTAMSQRKYAYLKKYLLA